jgi:hypothetical protein
VDRVGCNRNGDESGHDDEAGEDCAFVAGPFGNEAVDEETYDLSAVGCLKEG